MRYELWWASATYALLEKIWRDSTRHEELARSIDLINLELRNDPSSKGESRFSRRRVFFAPPLAVTYEVQDRLLEVRIVDIWHFRTHRSE